MDARAFFVMRKNAGMRVTGTPAGWKGYVLRRLSSVWIVVALVLGACLLTGRDERQAREGFNRVSLSGLLGSAPTVGSYWLQLSSSSGRARAGLAFRVMPPHDGQPRGHGR